MEKPEKESLDFASVIASAVHDMKNSLAILMTAISALEKKYPASDSEDKKQQAVLQYESSRLNSALVQLLGLYKIEQKQLPINLNYYNLFEFLSDQAAQYEPLAKSKDITIDIDAEDDLDGCFDIDLISSVINNVLGNAIRYTKSKILLSAYFDDALVIEIADDGTGYPQNMIEQQHNFIKSIDYSTGSTGLGLYFAAKIAKIHQNDTENGNIELANGGQLNGGIFRIRLPN
ncbi:MAG: HAMP domain-containing histidine kinase [Gammaproteobacteria bacterium]|nr:HAMP domain-containing histidine kinase [Gammaproteobacteria bacterium]